MFKTAFAPRQRTWHQFPVFFLSQASLFVLGSLYSLSSLTRHSLFLSLFPCIVRRIAEIISIIIKRSANYDRPGECSPEKDCLWWPWLTFRHPERNSSSESNELWMVRRVKSLWSLSWLVDDHWSLVVCQLSRHVIGREDCKTWLVHFDPSFVGQMSVGLLLVKSVGLSIVCLSCYCRQSVVCKVQAIGNGSVVFVLS